MTTSLNFVSAIVANSFKPLNPNSTANNIPMHNQNDQRVGEKSINRVERGILAELMDPGVVEKEIKIIGAGPVGCLLACLLVDLGFTCTIYEKRNDPRGLKDGGKSINLALSYRGLTALSLLRENEKKKMKSVSKSVRMPGRCIHLLGKSDTYQPYSIHPEECLFSVNRRGLGNDLIKIAESRGVKFIFQHPLKSVDFKTKEVTFVDTTNNTELKVQYEILFGADGSNSQVRKEMARDLNVNNTATKFTSGYKEFEIPSKDGNFQLAETLHVWPRDSATFLIAFPNADKSFTSILFGPTDGPECIANMNDSQISNVFETQYTDVFNIVGKDKITSDHKQNPFSSLWIVDSEKWNYKGDVLLIGDAAHGIVPYLGLGINAGFEGCRHLINLIRKYSSDGNGDSSSVDSPPPSLFSSFSFSDSSPSSSSSSDSSPSLSPSTSYSSLPSITSFTTKFPLIVDWEKVFEEFNNYKKHTDILSRAAVKNAHELHKSIQSDHFLFQKEVERELQKLHPTKFMGAHALYSFTNVPFEAISKQVQAQELITKELCKNISQLDQVDWTRANHMVDELLKVDLSTVKMWYED